MQEAGTGFASKPQTDDAEPGDIALDSWVRYDAMIGTRQEIQRYQKKSKTRGIHVLSSVQNKTTHQQQQVQIQVRYDHFADRFATTTLK